MILYLPIGNGMFHCLLSVGGMFWHVPMVEGMFLLIPISSRMFQEVPMVMGLPGGGLEGCGRFQMVLGCDGKFCCAFLYNGGESSGKIGLSSPL